MRVTYKSGMGVWVSEEMTKEEYRRFKFHRAVKGFLAGLIAILSIVCGSIWLNIFLGM